MLDSPPALMTSEIDPRGPGSWRLDAFFEGKPAARDIALLQSLVPSAQGTRPLLERLPDEDWVTLSQQGLEPIRAGCFFVHTPAHRGEVPDGLIAFEIDAGRAFGTGHHQTTAGCLRALDRARRAGESYRNILDLGTGTGLLAFAALRLWPTASVVASDVDRVAVDVSAENAAVNGIKLGRGPSQVELVTASGLNHRRLRARAPFDLIIANILAEPLIALAPSIAAALAPGGRLILSGILEQQASKVVAAYRRQDMMASFNLGDGDWAILAMRKRRRPPRRGSA